MEDKRYQMPKELKSEEMSLNKFLTLQRQILKNFEAICNKDHGWMVTRTFDDWQKDLEQYLRDFGVK